MRTAVIAVVLVAGCAKPQPAESPTVAVVPQPAAPVEIAPAPWEVPSDPQRAERYQWYQQNDVALLRALARREIRAGDDIEPLVKQFPECRVFRNGVWVHLSISHGPFIVTGVLAKNGKLVRGATVGCYHLDVFFDTMTPEDRDDCTRIHSE